VRLVVLIVFVIIIAHDEMMMMASAVVLLPVRSPVHIHRHHDIFSSFRVLFPYHFHFLVFW
jgi:hypothetical protein